MKQPRLIISCNPEHTTDFSQFAAIINVADSECQTFKANIPSFWFPVHEVNQWGYGPFYGAAKVVDYFRDHPNPILIHCHAGANRSPSIAYAIMMSDGMSYSHIESLYPLYGRTENDEGIGSIYDKNVKKGYVFSDTISMLTARHAFPSYSLMGLLQVIKSPHLFSKKSLAVR